MTPLPDANYAVDEGWARIYPYSAKGKTVSLELRVDNHTGTAQEFRVRWNVPKGWELVRGAERVTVEAHSGGVLPVVLRAAEPGEVSVLTVDVAFAGFDLRRWTEALLERDEQ